LYDFLCFSSVFQAVFLCFLVFYMGWDSWIKRDGVAHFYVRVLVCYWRYFTRVFPLRDDRRKGCQAFRQAAISRLVRDVSLRGSRLLSKLRTGVTRGWCREA
jgi:hypothetical protein